MTERNTGGPAFRAIATAALVALCATAHANFKDGNRLLADLNNTGASNTQIMPALGLGYIMGVADAYGGITHCPPDNVTAGQVRDMVRNYLENNPAIRHLPANQIVVSVLRGVWPCADKPAGRQL